MMININNIDGMGACYYVHYDTDTDGINTYLNSATLFRSPDVPGFCPAIGFVGTVSIVKSLSEAIGLSVLD